MQSGRKNSLMCWRLRSHRRDKQAADRAVWHLTNPRLEADSRLLSFTFRDLVTLTPPFDIICPGLRIIFHGFWFNLMAIGWPAAFPIWPLHVPICRAMHPNTHRHGAKQQSDDR